MPEQQQIDPNYLALQQQVFGRQSPRSQQIPTGPLILSQLINQIGQNFGNASSGSIDNISGIRNVINDRNKQAYIDFNLETELLTTQLEQLKEQMKLRGELKRNYDDEILRGLGIEKEREGVRSEKGLADIRGESLKQAKEQGSEDLLLKKAQVQSEQALAFGRERDIAQAEQESLDELLIKMSQAQKAPLETEEQRYKTEQAKIKRDRDQVELNIFNMADRVLKDETSSPQAREYAVSIIRNANLKNSEDEALSPVEKAMKYNPIASALGMKMKTESLDAGDFQKFLGIVETYAEDIPEPARRIINETSNKIIDTVKEKDFDSQKIMRDEIIDTYSEPAYWNAFRSTPDLIGKFRKFIDGTEDKQLPLTKKKNRRLLDQIKENYLLKLKGKEENLVIEEPNYFKKNLESIGPVMSIQKSKPESKKKVLIYEETLSPYLQMTPEQRILYKKLIEGYE